MPDRGRDERPEDAWKREFKQNMRRVGEELARGVVESALYQAGRAAEDFRRGVEERAGKERARSERKLNRAERRAEKHRLRRERKFAGTTAFEGYINLAIAVVLVGMAVAMPQIWWLVFIALAFAIRGGRVVSFHRTAQAQPVVRDDSGAPIAPAGIDPRAAQIDAVGNKLLAALKSAPKAVRDFISTPEETIQALQKTSHELLKREIALRALVSPAESARLDQERRALEDRIRIETDGIVKSRLTAALAALDNQRTQLVEIEKSANRLEAERTRLGYTLEGLYAQIMRAHAADAGSADLVNTGLRQSLDQLRDEVSAMADALDEVNRSSAAIAGSPETFEGGKADRERPRITTK